MATLRTRIIEAMRDKDWMTSRQVCNLVDGGYNPNISKMLHIMVNSSLAESRPTTHWKLREFKLISCNISIPRGTVRKFIDENPGLSVEEIAARIPCRKATVIEYLRNAMRDEKVTREKNSEGKWAYTAKEDNGLPFGMQNPMRFMFEDLLKQARQNTNK